MVRFCIWIQHRPTLHEIIIHFLDLNTLHSQSLSNTLPLARHISLNLQTFKIVSLSSGVVFCNDDGSQGLPALRNHPRPLTLALQQLMTALPIIPRYLKDEMQTLTTLQGYTVCYFLNAKSIDCFQVWKVEQNIRSAACDIDQISMHAVNLDTANPTYIAFSNSH